MANAAPQAELQSLRNSLAEWQSIGELAGVADAFVMGPVTPAGVASELARARESEKQLQVPADARKTCLRMRLASPGHVHACPCTALEPAVLARQR